MSLVSTVFPDAGMRMLSNVVNVVGVTVCAFCFARRSAREDLLSFAGWANMSWARLCVLLVFLDSWLFIACSWLLTDAVGLSRSESTCSLAMYACIFFYASSKFLIYLFLVEKVYIVWRAGPQSTRLGSRIYVLCMLVLATYLGIFVLLLVGKVAFLRADAACVIGLRVWASAPLLAYDLAVNAFLTSLFLWPILRARVPNARLRRVTSRTLVAAVASLVSSSVNMAILTAMRGRQLGWVCLGACGADVIANALVLYWTTASRVRPGTASAPAPRSSSDGPPDVGKALPLTPRKVELAPETITRPERAQQVTFFDEPVLERQQSRGGVLARAANALRRKRSPEDEEHAMSVQITITTEVDRDTPDSVLDDPGSPKMRPFGAESEGDVEK